MSTTSINSMQWLDLATNIKNITTISFTLEAQFVFQKSVSSSALRTSESTTWQTIPGDGISKPAIIITTEKSPYLQDPRRKLEDTTMFHTIELLEEIFASGLAEHVRKKAFTQDWTKLVIPAACYTQDSADNKNMFQLGSRASLSLSTSTLSRYSMRHYYKSHYSSSSDISLLSTTVPASVTTRPPHAAHTQYVERAPHDANRTFDGSAVVAEQRQFPGVDYTMEFSAAPHEHGIDLTRFCISTSTGGSDGRPPPPHMNSSQMGLLCLCKMVL
ncbi:hypothetical protein BD769DRAFT_1390118 [Suillus cothurnatus]|nr:hypothetical protein BD769DRAFT_1390118 [Suillus cothurnatus]